eukprot:scaffold2751_cov131-Cylindrotheca_fusiformis.AAC.12
MSQRCSKKTFLTTLCTASAVLAAKIGIVHFLTVRSRMMSKDPAVPHDGGNALLPVLRNALLCFGSDFGGKKFVFLGERLAKNCAENEPFFLVLAGLCGMTGAVPNDIGCTLVTVFTAARVAHSGVFLLGDKVNTAFRSTPYVVGLACNFMMAGFGLFDLK